MVERGTVTSGRADDEQQNLTPSVVAFGGGAVSFFTGSAIFIILGGTLPSSTPLASISGHMGWFGGVAFLGIGAVALMRGDSFRTGLAGYLAIGALGLGALQGLQWATWTYVDVLAAQHDQYDPLLEALISPYGAGHALTYGILVMFGIRRGGIRIRTRSSIWKPSCIPIRRTTPTMCSGSNQMETGRSSKASSSMMKRSAMPTICY